MRKCLDTRQGAVGAAKQFGDCVDELFYSYFIYSAALAYDKIAKVCMHAGEHGQVLVAARCPLSTLSVSRERAAASAALPSIDPEIGLYSSNRKVCLISHPAGNQITTF